MLKIRRLICTSTVITSLLATNIFAAEINSTDKATVKDEHGDIGLGKETASSHTQHPDA